MNLKNIDKRLLLGAVFFALLQIGLTYGPKLRGKKLTQKASIDTFVPLGFTLVPIQIENHLELHSLVDRFAIVDLHKEGVKDVVASGVRLLRSPKNPEVFAVLIEQEKARELISEHGAQFTVSVKSPEAQPEKKPKKRTIILESL